MIPGLWLEPEVVGVNSRELSRSRAGLCRMWELVPRSRLGSSAHLRAPAEARLDLAVDPARHRTGRLQARLQRHAGAGHRLRSPECLPRPARAQSRPAHWLDGGVLDRHPNLILENCGSGALRSDFAMLSRLQLQSTSDQQDPLLHPAIAVGALLHILPEQAANWAYPQATMTDEMISFTMCTGMAGRLYQAGLLNLMTDEQLSLVAEGIGVHKSTRHALAHSRPSFPTGMPSWNDAWTTVAFHEQSDIYLLAWRQAHASADITLDLPGLDASLTDIAQIYPLPARLPEWSTSPTSAGPSIKSPEGIAAARFLKITRRSSPRSADDRLTKSAGGPLYRPARCGRRSDIGAPRQLHPTSARAP